MEIVTANFTVEMVKIYQALVQLKSMEKNFVLLILEVTKSCLLNGTQIKNDVLV